MTGSSFQQLWEANQEHIVYDGEFSEGDLAIYGPPYAVEQVARCVASGSSKTARWRSLTGGSSVRLSYRPDLLVVVRPLENAA